MCLGIRNRLKKTEIKGKIIKIVKDNVVMEKYYYSFSDTVRFYGKREVDIVILTDCGEVPVRAVFTMSGRTRESVIAELSKKKMEHGATIRGTTYSTRFPIVLRKPEISS
jgi:hypothetical protein